MQVLPQDDEALRHASIAGCKQQRRKQIYSYHSYVLIADIHDGSTYLVITLIDSMQTHHMK